MQSYKKMFAPVCSQHAALRAYIQVLRQVHYCSRLNPTIFKEYEYQGRFSLNHKREHLIMHCKNIFSYPQQNKLADAWKLALLRWTTTTAFTYFIGFDGYWLFTTRLCIVASRCNDCPWVSAGNCVWIVSRFFIFISDNKLYRFKHFQ